MRNGFQSLISLTSIGAAAVVATGLSLSPSALLAQGDSATTKKSVEPVFRVSKLVNDSVSAVDEEDDIIPGAGERVARSPELPMATTAATGAPHPLDRALTYANEALATMQAEVQDYTAILAKRERMNGVVGDPSYMNIKVRCPRTDAQGNNAPFSLYMKFLKPKDASGREVIWVDGQNDGNIIAHEGKGIIALKRFYLPPTGALAMRGQRYPIYDAGLENLIVKLIEKAERDRAAGMCTVNYKEGVTINKRSCSLIELIHEDCKHPYEFYKAQVFIDDELNLPVRYAAYDWPLTPDGEAPLIEEYTYFNVKTNVGLTDHDFNPDNPSYKFPNH